MEHHDKPDEHDETTAGGGSGNNDGSTDNPDTEVTLEDEQDTASGGAPERP